ncbi:Sensitive to high expression protein [Ceratobasidium sp. AG-Ba]|nr:Sensitive to high expression protein [Ceratobasidium sp. AG-Ba]QRW06717.1 Sensitive to high expression protein [Ceratobasidium sp. AG-Ba]
MLRLATTRRTPLSRFPLAPVILGPRWTSGKASGMAPGKTDAKKAKEEQADKVVKEYLDSLKPASEGSEKSSIAIPESDISRVAASTSASSASTSSSVTPSSSSAGSSSAPVSMEEHTARAKDSIAMWKDATISLLRSRAQDAAGQLGELGGKLNKVTGYDEIEELKRKVVEKERTIAALRNAAREAKTAYTEAVQNRATRQRQVNDLLQRKSSWSDADLLSFTQLVREDHLSASLEQQAKLQLDAAEAAVDTEFGALMRAILDRYHEEQVWSDKIRSVSTYGSLAALIANMVVFVLAIVIVEPWKRRRLAQTFEGQITEMEAETRELVGGGIKSLEERFEKQEKVLEALAKWAEPVLVDHERPPVQVPELEPVVEAGDAPEPVAAPEIGVELPPVEKVRVWLEALVPTTDRDYALVAIGGVASLAGIGLASFFRSR